MHLAIGRPVAHDGSTRPNANALSISPTSVGEGCNAPEDADGMNSRPSETVGTGGPYRT